MKYKVICNGDSWVFGCEIVDPLLKAQHPPDLYVGEYDFVEENINYRTDRIWPTYLREYLNCETVNLAWPADDNKTILQRTIDYVTQNYLATGKSTDELILIIGWSSPERNSWWWHDNTLPHNFRLWPHVKHFINKAQEKFWEIYVTYLWNPEEYVTRYILDNLNFQNFCIANNIKYLVYNSFYQIRHKHVSSWDQDLTELIDKLHKQTYSIDDPDTKKRSFVDFNWKDSWNQIKSPNYYRKNEPLGTFNQFIKSKLENPYVGLHPSPEAHKIWAQEIATYLKENIIK